LKELFKLGNGKEPHLPHMHPNVWAKDNAKGVLRLKVAAATQHVALLTLLLEKMNPPFLLLYVLVVPRTENEAGRYQSVSTYSTDEVVEYLEMHREALEQDARHSIWIKSVDAKDLIIYDRHQIIYLYGPLSAFEQVLLASGLHQTSEIVLPDPHSHHYWKEFDEDERGILSNCEWVLSPLQPADEE